MRFSGFLIKNFKGIVDTSIRFDIKPSGNIFALVGLNESGKTSVLEAINLWAGIDNNPKVSSIKNYLLSDVHRAIPKNRKIYFDDTISITAYLKLDLEDIDLINQ